MSEPTILTPMTLPDNDNVNEYAFAIELTNPWFMKKGAMIAYYGQVTFDALARTNLTAMVAARFSSPLYVQDWVVTQGHGKVILGDRGFDINSYDLDDGNLTIKATNLLAFETGLVLEQSIIPGFLTLLGTGKFLASSNGPVMFAEPPVRVDPEALLGWADCPSPSVHFDTGWMHSFLGAAANAVLGVQSGEERQYNFSGSGTVLMQSSEVPRHDPNVVRLIDSQLQNLAPSGLQSLQATIQRLLGAQQQR